MLPSFTNLSLGAKAPQASRTKYYEPSKGITKKTRDPHQPLPPGWTTYTNNAGDVQYTDGLIHTYTVAQAWIRYNKSQKEISDTDLCERNEAYGSISKELHRIRIINDMMQYVCTTGKTPSLVYLGAPDGSDSKFFQRQVRSHNQLKGTRLVAVNLAAIQRVDGTYDVEYITDTIENYMASVDDNTFSHAWLDTTSMEIDNELLWNTVRGTVDRIYLVVSLKGNSGYRSKEDSAIIVNTQCEFFGLSIKHQEAYCGITPKGGQSNKINMMLFTCKIEYAKILTTYHMNYNSIGAIIYIPKEMIENNIYEDGSIFEYINTYVGLVKGYDLVSAKWSIQFFDVFGNLLPDAFYITPSKAQKISIYNRSYFK